MTGFGIREGLLERGNDLFGFGGPQSDGPVGLGQLDEVRRDSLHGGGGIALFIEQFLPLPDHPEIAVVQDRHLDRKLILDHRGQFLGIHLKAAVSCNVNHEPVREGHLGAHGRREAVSHRPQSPGGEEGPGLGEMIVLGGPHLVLSDLCRDDGLPLGQLVDLLNDELGFDRIFLLLVIEIVDGPPSFDLMVPFFEPLLVSMRYLHPREGTGSL